MKETVSAPSVVVDSADIAVDAVSDQPAPLVPPSFSLNPPVPNDNSAQLLGVRSDILGQIKSLFDNFAVFGSPFY